MSERHSQELKRLLSSGLQPVRTVLRALALQQLARGDAIRKVASNVGLTPKTVWLVSQRINRAVWSGPYTSGPALASGNASSRWPAASHRKAEPAGRYAYWPRNRSNANWFLA